MEATYPDAVPPREYLRNEVASSAVINVDDDIDRVQVILDSTGWVDTGKEILKVDAEVFYNTLIEPAKPKEISQAEWARMMDRYRATYEKKWTSCGGAGFMGGVHVHRFGFQMIYRPFWVDLLPGTGRLVRVHYRALDPVRIKTDIDLIYVGNP